MTRPVRRNFAHLSTQEQQAYVEAVRQADLHTYPDGVSFWDKQDQIHQGTHNHRGNSFLPWHRELVNRYEKLLQQYDPDVALHYWDWTTDPRSTADGRGGVVDLSAPSLLGSMTGLLNGTLAALHNGGVLAGSRDDTGNPADPPRSVTRNAPAGAPAVAADATILASADGLPRAQQWEEFRQELERAHDTAHGFVGGNIGASHRSFEDPFVYLLHSNVDRLFAMWQTAAGQDWRLDPGQVYGDQSETTGDDGIRNPMHPWDGAVEFGAPIEPWVGTSASIVTKDCRDPSVVRPPCYDTLPLHVEQVTPVPGDPVRFLDVVEQLPTARALRLRVRGCVAVTATAAVTGPFDLLSAATTAPAQDGFASRDLLVWVLYHPGAAGTTGSGSVTVTVAETGQVFTVPITATVVANPTVATSLVLDTSGSMALPSGLPGRDRMAVLRDAAPLFVSLLDPDDGVGVVRFDTDAHPAGAPVADAGPTIGGAGRLAAATAIATTTTNPAGLTAIGDGLEAAAAQLALVGGAYDSTATVVFTDGYETAERTIAQAADSVTSRVFAIGLGTADQLNPGALADLTNGTHGYLLLTGNASVDDQVLLQKYFAQVLAGATNASIIVDPAGFVPVGGEVEVPFDVTAADIRTDVLLLGQLVRVLSARVVAADGTEITAGAGAVESDGAAYRVLRIVPADVLAPGVAAGRWRLVLRVDDTALDRYVRELRSEVAERDPDHAGRRLEEFLGGVKAHGVPYTVSVQARSAVTMDVTVSQSSRLPGSSGHLRATLTDSGIPLSAGAAVTATVTDPDGVERLVALVGSEPGVYTAEVPTERSGVYRVLTRAAGADLRGARFTREQLRTLPVWSRGDEPAPPVRDPGGRSGGVDVCGLLTCLLGDDPVRRFLAKREIDPDRLVECVKRSCG